MNSPLATRIQGREKKGQQEKPAPSASSEPSLGQDSPPGATLIPKPVITGQDTTIAGSIQGLSDPKACESAEDKTAPLASRCFRQGCTARTREPPWLARIPGPWSHLDKTPPLASSVSKACESAEDKTAPLASSDPKACESAEDKTAPLASFNDTTCQSGQHKGALLSCAVVYFASSHSKPPESSEERSGLLSSALASSCLACSSLASFHSKTCWETGLSHVEMPAERARGIKPKDSPCISGLLIMENPSPPEPTIGRLILVEDSPEDDCFTPSGSAPPCGNGSDKARNTSNNTNTAHRLYPGNDFNSSPCQPARSSVPLIHRTCPQLLGQKSLQVSFPRVSSACPSPRAARRHLASPSQPKTSMSKLF
eukprot:gene18483-24979_t